MGLWLYCKRIRFDVQPQNGPTILACNHPNSFLDALIIGSHYKRSIHFLARGDVFAKPFVARLLRGMNMIPIHRLSEGRAGSKDNEQTFRKCFAVLQAKGTLLIFSEGLCENEWTIRSLKKGTARLSYGAWHEEGIKELKVTPVTLSYLSFTSLPIRVDLKAAASIHLKEVTVNEAAQFYNEFNSLLRQRLESNLRSSKEIVEEQNGTAKWRIWLLVVPAIVGWLTHRGLYRVLRNFSLRKTTGTVFYHSVLFALLLIVYPVVLLVVVSCIVLLTHQPSFWLLLLLLPFTAWCYKEYKGIKQRN